MTNFQKAFCVLMSFCFFAALAMMPDFFLLQDNIFRQLPLYCFLEKEAKLISQREDLETNELLITSHGDYLGERVLDENGQGEKPYDGTVENSDKPYETQNADGETAGITDGISEKDGETAGTTDEISEKDGETAGITDETSEKDGETAGIMDETSEKDGEAAGITDETSEKDGETAGITDGTSEKDGETDKITDEASGSGGKSEENMDTQAAARIASSELKPHPEIDLSLESLADFDYLLNQFYIVDSNTSTNEEQLNAEEFLAADLTMEQDPSRPQILIYHSHSQEAFADSREGEIEDTIVGVGNYLTQLLTENYGYQVIHVTEAFDIIEGEIDRSRAYDYAREYVEQVMEEYPSIEVLIDLHRDGISEDRHLVTEINGKDTAQIMFYNGLSYTVNNGPVSYLPNPYIQDNLAFSFQLEYQAALYYPELYRGIYLAGLRYNLHLCPKALLLEAGAQTNTVQEVKNAMEPFADILNRVLCGTK